MLISNFVDYLFEDLSVCVFGDQMELATKEMLFLNI